MSPPGPALLVYYHGAIPVDMIYLVCDVYLTRGRLVRCIADKFIFSFPGLTTLFRTVFSATPGSREECAGLLQDGHLLAISPGGMYEAQMGDNNYDTLWRNRDGFAKVLQRVLVNF